MAMSEGSTPIECGFCSRTDIGMVDPVKLPCDHIHCRSCLSALYEYMKFMECPDCSTECQMEQLLPYSGRRHTILCDGKTCTKLAVEYCITCPNKRWCKDHQQRHVENSADHRTITVDEYRKVWNRQEKRECDCGVNKEPVHRACLCCLALSCVNCIQHKKAVGGEVKHDFVSLDEVVTELSAHLNTLKDRLNVKQEQLTDLFEQTGKSLNVYNKHTEHLLRMIKERREEQVAAIDAEYQKLESNLNECRQRTRLAFESFNSDIVRKRLEFKVAELKIDSHLNYKHQADVIIEHKEMKQYIQQLIDEALPTKCLPNVTKLVELGSRRQIELDFRGRDGKHSLYSPYKDCLSCDSSDDEFEDADDGSHVGDDFLQSPDQDDLSDLCW